MSSEFDHAAVLAKCARGEHDALHQLYIHEGARLLGVVLRIVKDRGMAEDIVHDACLNIWQRADSFDPDKGSARAWIFSVARHLALNAIRYRDREITFDSDAPTELGQDEHFQHADVAEEAFDCTGVLQHPAERDIVGVMFERRVVGPQPTPMPDHGLGSIRHDKTESGQEIGDRRRVVDGCGAQ